ncbi:hypothetical protein AAG570_002564 [Ranatra chinensis]|uniref:Uncharacterized protein n=1 Tax=Ranatra chinensis TaxID=642074 RepID=A0ABD0Y9Z6_9HEMI
MASKRRNMFYENRCDCVVPKAREIRREMRRDLISITEDASTDVRCRNSDIYNIFFGRYIIMRGDDDTGEVVDEFLKFYNKGLLAKDKVFTMRDPSTRAETISVIDLLFFSVDCDTIGTMRRFEWQEMMRRDPLMYKALLAVQTPPQWLLMTLHHLLLFPHVLTTFPPIYLQLVRWLYPKMMRRDPLMYKALLAVQTPPQWLLMTLHRLLLFPHVLTTFPPIYLQLVRWLYPKMMRRDPLMYKALLAVQTPPQWLLMTLHRLLLFPHVLTTFPPIYLQLVRWLYPKMMRRDPLMYKALLAVQTPPQWLLMTLHHLLLFPHVHTTFPPIYLQLVRWLYPKMMRRDPLMYKALLAVQTPPQWLLMTLHRLLLFPHVLTTFPPIYLQLVRWLYPKMMRRDPLMYKALLAVQTPPQWLLMTLHRLLLFPHVLTTFPPIYLQLVRWLYPKMMRRDPLMYKALLAVQTPPQWLLMTLHRLLLFPHVHTTFPPIYLQLVRWLYPKMMRRDPLMYKALLAVQTPPQWLLMTLHRLLLFPHVLTTFPPIYLQLVRWLYPKMMRRDPLMYKALLAVQTPPQWLLMTLHRLLLFPHVLTTFPPIYLQLVRWLYPKMNYEQFTYAQAVATLHRPDQHPGIDYRLPNWYDVFPNYFVPAGILGGVQAAVKEGNYNASDPPVFVAGDEDGAASYFTRDVGLNNMFYNWNIYFPHWMDPKKYNMTTWKNRGEIFFDYHQQLFAHFYVRALPRVQNIWEFDYEDPVKHLFILGIRKKRKIYKIYNQTTLVIRLSPLRLASKRRTLQGHPPRNSAGDGEQLRIDMFFVQQFGYATVLANSAGRLLATRPPEFRADDSPQRKELVRIEMLTYDLIANLTVHLEGNGTIKMKEDDREVISLLGNLLYNTTESVNPSLYQSYYTAGIEYLASLGTDPQKDGGGIAGYPMSAPSDPEFYPLLMRVNEAITAYKHYHNRKFYEKKLVAADFKFESISCSRLETFFEPFDVDVTSVVDGSSEPKKYIVRQLRLNHKPFTITMNITNRYKEKEHALVTVVFILDVFNKLFTFAPNDGIYQVFSKVPVMLEPGTNIIERSFDSSAMYVDEDKEMAQCGIPRRLALPKGTTEGLKVNLIAFVGPHDGTSGGPPRGLRRTPVCGGLEHNYGRPFGFPFDLFTNNINFDKSQLGIHNATVFHTPKTFPHGITI